MDDPRDCLRPVGTCFTLSHEDENGQTISHTWEVAAHAQGAGDHEGNPTWHEVLQPVVPTPEEVFAAMGEQP